jgi:MYXO-CTERM domain-containing protein
VRYLERSTSEPNRIRAVEVDLCAAGVSIRATKSAERRRTPSSFGEAVGAHVVVNGDFFSYADYSTIGLAIGDGERWSGSMDGPGSGFVAFGPGRAVVQPLRDDVASPPAWMKDVVSGKPQIVTDGQVIADGSSEFCLTRHPRTAAGLSRDGKKLILAVVDGRSSTSRGMRCSELGMLMKGLGAHNALNLDGGGSSAMWVRGKGVVNRPSDGSQRVVANHLAVIASGSGAPEACGSADAELVRDQIAYWAPSSTTDVNADGRADVCGRGADGVVCLPMSAAGAGAKIDGPALSDDSGWSDASNYATLRWGDIDGDGDADLCARVDAGVRCWRAEGDGFTAPFNGPALSDDSGWSDEQYYTSMTLTDVNGDQRDDLCMRASAGIRCYPSQGDAFGAAISGPALGAAWAEPRYYGTLRWGDVTGDGKADVCGRDADGVRCWPSTGTGFGAAIQGPRWSDATGWDKPQHWSTLRLADVNGDGKMDVCARAGAGMRCVLSKGMSFGDTITGPLADASGWTDQTNYGTIRFGDINGDGKDDLCARANARFVCWPSTGAGFGAIIDGPLWSDADGWTDRSRWGTVQLADVNGDGKQDVCGRAPSGVECWLSDGSGFPTKVSGPAWGGSGWAAAAHYSTLRVSGPRCIVTDEVCANGVDDDCDGQIDEGCQMVDMGMMEPDMGPDMAQDLGQAEEPDMAEVADLGPDSDADQRPDMPTPDEDLSNSGERPDGELISTSETSSCICAAPGGAAGAPSALWMLALAAAGLWRRRR